MLSLDERADALRLRHTLPPGEPAVSVIARALAGADGIPLLDAELLRQGDPSQIAAFLALFQVAPYDAGTLHVSGGIDWNNGPVQKATMPAATVTACPIANGAEGRELELILAGQAQARSFTGLSGGGLPSDSLFAWPKTIEANKRYVLKFKYINAAWRLVSLVGGF